MEHVSIILIVDDHPVGRTTLEALLAKEGYQLEMASSGPEALIKAAELLPDLMLLDVMMPGMDGMEVCRRLRADPDLAELPIIMVTALDDDTSRLQGIEAGADDFISKPFDRVELRSRIRTITRLNRYRRIAIEREQRQQAEAQSYRQLQRLEILHDIDMKIAANLDSATVLDTLVSQIHSRLKLAAVDILLLNAITGKMEYAAGCGFQSSAIKQRTVDRGQGPAGYAALKRSLVYIADISKTKAGSSDVSLVCCNGVPPQHDISHLVEAAHAVDIMRSEHFASYYAVPLIARGEAKGVLEIFHYTPLKPDRDWLNFLETLAGQSAIALDNADLFEDLQQSYDATLEGWVKALDLRDKETEGHSQRVTELTVQLARSMGLTGMELEHIRRGALLHDIGKLGISDSILLKPGPLTTEEWVIMRQHPQFAYEWLSPINYLRLALDIPYCHHEKWDGTGYPRGLSGKEIPLAARMFAVVDVWDALSSDRPYRQRWPEEQVYAYLQEQAGKHFDPLVVEAFLRMRSCNAVTVGVVCS